jgi:hypothetical protein
MNNAGSNGRAGREPMTANGAMLLVFSLLATAFFVWFLASIAEDVNQWLAKNQHLSGWAQALGAALAVIAAWLLTRRQIAAGVAAERERDRLRRLQHLQLAHLIFSSLLTEAENMRGADLGSFGGREDIQRCCRTAATELDALVLHELPGVIALQASSARSILVQIEGRVSERDKLAATAQAFVKSSVVVLSRVATRGRNLAHSLAVRTATADELAQERAMRQELVELRAAVDAEVPF